MKWAAILALLLTALLWVGCGDGDEAPAAKNSGCTDSFYEVSVFAASSLGDAFTVIGSQTRCESGLIPEFNLGGSQQLRTQIEQGAEAEIFASADRLQMDKAREFGAVTGVAQLFARNKLVVVIPEANDAGIETLEDLARDDVEIVVAGPEVPVGAYTRSFLSKASADPTFGEDFERRVLENVVSEESNVSQVLAKVQIDEVDAGIVYATDARSGVQIIEIPDELNEVAEYFIATVKESSPTAQPFIDYVLSEAGQDILEEHGFIRVDQ